MKRFLPPSGSNLGLLDQEASTKPTKLQHTVEASTYSSGSYSDGSFIMAILNSFLSP